MHVPELHSGGCRYSLHHLSHLPNVIIVITNSNSSITTQRLAPVQVIMTGAGRQLEQEHQREGKAEHWHDARTRHTSRLPLSSCACTAAAWVREKAWPTPPRSTDLRHRVQNTNGIVGEGGRAVGRGPGARLAVTLTGQACHVPG
jgi:hypothetical protein